MKTTIVFFLILGIAMPLSSEPLKVTDTADILKGLKEVRRTIEDRALFTYDNSAPYLDTLYKKVFHAGSKYFYSKKKAMHSKEIVMESYKARIALRNKLTEFSNVKGEKNTKIVESARRIFRAARYIEDMAGEIYLENMNRQLKRNSPQFFRPFRNDRDPKAYGTLNKGFPWLLTTGDKKVRIKSGDIFLSRGNAFSSAAISKIGRVDSQFSHLAIVYIDGEPDSSFTIEEITKMNNAKIVEAHIEVGNTIRTFKEYLNDGNARVLHFRLRQKQHDNKSPHIAAKASHDLVRNYLAENKANLPYDFHSVIEDHSEVNCTEIVYYGYERIGIILPLYRTKVQSNDFTKKTSLNIDSMFAPGDLEMDPRFELLAEWRDYRKMRDIRYKDAILVKIFHWMERDNYRFNIDSIMFFKANLAKTLRKFGMYKKTLPKNMPIDTIKTVFVLDKVGAILQKELEKADDKYFQKEGIRMSANEMYNFLESLKVKDRKTWSRKGKGLFHFYLHPKKR